MNISSEGEEELQHTNMVFKNILEKLEEEKQQTRLGNTSLRETSRARERYFDEGILVGSRIGPFSAAEELRELLDSAQN